jgi:hypothetical protein
MAARHDPGPARRDGDRRRRNAPRHSIAETDPMRWMREDDATTADLPAYRHDSGETTVGLPAIDRRRRHTHGPGSAPTVQFSDFPDIDVPEIDVSDIVDNRQPPERRKPAAPRLAPHGYAARHRRATHPAEATRLGLSTVGMTVAVGVLGAALAIMHADPNRAVDQAQPPLPLVSPTNRMIPTDGTTVAPQPTGSQPGTAGATTSPGPSRPLPSGSPAPPGPTPGPTDSGDGSDSGGGTGPTRGQTHRPTGGRPTRTTPPASGLGSPKPTRTGCAATSIAPGEGDATPELAASVSPQADDVSADPSASPTPSTSTTCP